MDQEKIDEFVDAAIEAVYAAGHTVDVIRDILSMTKSGKQERAIDTLDSALTAALKTVKKTVHVVNVVDVKQAVD